jgi:dolichol-phosphate mannosyltransferase
MAFLSVIVPAYNEEKSIVGALDDVLRDVASVVPDLEIIVIDDGSKDDTARLAQDYAAREPRIRVISKVNEGHGPALITGLEAARGDWVFLIDSDRQVSLESFARHWPMTEEYDVILGLRRPRHDPGYRKMISVLMRTLLRAQLGVDVQDGGTPYKLLRAEVWRAAQPLMRPNCWIPSVLLAAAALLRTDLRVLQVPVVHRARDLGPSTLNLGRIGRFCREGASDIAEFKRRSQAMMTVPAAND